MASLNQISNALDSLSQTLENELAEIAEALRQSGPTQEEVDAVVLRIEGLQERIRTIIP